MEHTKPEGASPTPEPVDKMSEKKLLLKVDKHLIPPLMVL